jgi:hypothetical protein
VLHSLVRSSALVVYRRRGTGQVVNLIDLEQNGVHNIMPYQLKVAFGEQMGDVLLGAGKKVVQTNHLQKRLQL